MASFAGWAAAWLDLSPSERLASEFLYPLLGQGLSANQALRQLSAAGLGIRRQSGLQLIKQIRAAATWGYRAEAVKDDEYLPTEGMPPRFFNSGRNYAYVVRINGVDADTGESRDQFITILSDTAMTKEQLSDMAFGISEGNYREDGLEFRSMDLVTGYRNYESLGL